MAILGLIVLYLVLVVLAAWRISHDFTEHEGPFGVYGHVRRGVKLWVEVQLDDSTYEQPVDHPLYWLYSGIDCPRCVSFGVSLVVLVLATSLLTFPLVIWWGVAGLVSWLDRTETDD